MISRESRHYRKHLRDLIVSVEDCIDAFEVSFRLDSDAERGQKLARIVNALELQKDIAKRYGLSPPEGK